MDNNGFISKNELHELFKAANLPLPGYRVREMVQELMKTSEQLTFDQFAEVSPTNTADSPRNHPKHPKIPRLFFLESLKNLPKPIPVTTTNTKTSQQHTHLK